MAVLKVTVTDVGGRPIAFRMQAFKGGQVIANVWDCGGTSLSLPTGKYTILVRHGFDYDAVRMDLDLSGAAVEKTVTLSKRYDVRSLGWYCGESHMHGQHGRTDQPRTFLDARRLAEANGLDYVQIAQAWTPDFAWTPLEALRQMAKDASTPQVAVNWNLESPKCYMGVDDGGESGNLHGYGHGCTLGLKERHDEEFWFTGPNFRIIQEIHRQNAVVTLAHPVRFWFNKGNFVSNWASEIAFDYVTGQGYDGVDILNDGSPVFFQHERVWWNLLNMGYKVAGTANSDGSIADGQAGRFRTYTRIAGDFSWEAAAQAIRRGACVASSGPMVLFQVDGQDSGTEFPADGRKHKAKLKVWSSPLPDETLVCVQVIRNGEIVQACDLRNQKVREWTGEFELSDTAFAWYAIRVSSTCKDPQSLATWAQPTELYEIAVASPVYFIPEGFRRPEPAAAKVRLRVMDEDGKPLAASVSVLDMGREIAHESVDQSGVAILQTPATAILIIRAPGYAEAKRDLYMDSPIFACCRNFNGFYTPEACNDLRKMLGALSFDVKLARSTTTR